MLFVFRFSILWILLSMFPLLANTLDDIQKRGVLRVGTESNYFPFEMTDKSGQLVGFDMDIAYRMAQAMGVKLEIVNGTVDSLIPGLVTNKYDIFIRGITLTQERNLKVNFSDPYFESGETLLIRKALANQVHAYGDLNQPNFRIVSKVGTTGEMAAKKFMPKAKYTGFETEQEAVTEVKNGNADAFVFDAPYNTVAMLLFAQDKLVHINKPFTYEPLAWAVRQGDVDFLNWLNHFLEQIRRDGTYDRLHHKWFVEDGWLALVAAP